MLNFGQKQVVLVLAPHPDDETLGAGGALLKSKANGHEIHWLIATQMRKEDGWPSEKIERRVSEIRNVAEAYQFSSVTELPFAAAGLEQVASSNMVGAISEQVQKIQPSVMLLPHRGDAHSDHQVVHDAGAACAKWFRYPSVKSVLSYETLSETDAAIKDAEKFSCDLFVDISDYIEKKLEILSFFNDEIQDFPFPRSIETVRALAQVRGSAIGSKAAEAYKVLRLIS